MKRSIGPVSYTHLFANILTANVGKLGPAHFTQPQQAIQYVECHDNATVFDYFQLEKEEIRLEERKACLLYTSAMWLSLIPGLGQIYNKQKTKGYIFLAVTVLFLAYFLGIGVGELSKLVTLGTVRGQDNSLFILIRGAFHLIITIVYFLFYALNIKDAGTVAKRINNGIAVPKTGKEMVQAIYENGFPYLLIIPSYIAMTFAIIFPVLVTLMIAFTNYDFKHTAPTTLLDWIGFQNFTNTVSYTHLFSMASSMINCAPFDTMKYCWKIRSNSP